MFNLATVFTTFFVAAPAFFSFLGSSTLGIAYCTLSKNSAKKLKNLSLLLFISSLFSIMNKLVASSYLSRTFASVSYASATTSVGFLSIAYSGLTFLYSGCPKNTPSYLPKIVPDKFSSLITIYAKLLLALL